MRERGYGSGNLTPNPANLASAGSPISTRLTAHASNNTRVGAIALELPRSRLRLLGRDWRGGRIRVVLGEVSGQSAKHARPIMDSGDGRASDRDCRASSGLQPRRIRLRSVECDSTGDSDSGDGVHGGFLFFIDWYHRPKLVFIETKEITYEVEFANGSTTDPKHVRVLFITIGNDGVLPATRPKISFHIWQPNEKREAWPSVLNLRRTVMDVEPIEAPIRAEGDRREVILARAFMKEALPQIEEIEPRRGEKFAFGFSFEERGQFFLATDTPLAIPLKGTLLMVNLSARASNRFQNPLYSRDFLLSIDEDWRSPVLSKLEEEPAKFLKTIAEEALSQEPSPSPDTQRG